MILVENMVVVGSHFCEKAQTALRWRNIFFLAQGWQSSPKQASSPLET
jgi:hypothetical protein